MALLSPQRGLATPARAFVILWINFAFGNACTVDAPELPPPADPPTRTAAQDRELRGLALEAASGRICQELEGQLLPLSEGGAPAGPAAGLSPAIGRLWVESCHSEVRGEGLALRLEGRGWSWIQESGGGPLLSRFDVRGWLRFRVALELVGEIDIAYLRSEQVVTAWLTPSEPVRPGVTLLGSLPVRPVGSWSGLVGALGQFLGGSLSGQARPVLARQANARIAGLLRNGLTATFDLCAGQRDLIVGALQEGQTPDRPYPGDGSPWLANRRVRLRPGGLDVEGPFRIGEETLSVDVEVDEGASVVARVVCWDEAVRTMEAFLVERRPPSAVPPRAEEEVEPGSPASLSAEGDGCALALILASQPRARSPSQVRFRARIARATAQPLVDCEPRRSE